MNRIPSFLLLLLPLAATSSPAAAPAPFLIHAPSRSTQQLWTIAATPADGGLSLSVAATFPLGFPAATIAAHPEKPLLYVTANNGEEGHTPGAVLSLDDAGLAHRAEPLSLRHGYSYLSLDRTNRYLLGSNYFAGHIDVHALDDAGVPRELVFTLHEGHPNAHCILPSADNRFIYIPYVKEHNALYQYRFEADTGRLTALTPKNPGPPDGTGPRHLAYHPMLPVLYFSNEQHLGISVYDQAAEGHLTLRQVCDAVNPDEPKDGVSASDLVITPDGQFLFAGIRGHEREFDWIARYRILPDGEVALLGLTPADKIPWGLALSPDGAYLLVSAFQGATLTAYRIAPDGSLTQAASLPWDSQISDLVTR